MKHWKCPKCHRERYFTTELILKVCTACQCEMEVGEDGRG